MRRTRWTGGLLLLVAAAAAAPAGPLHKTVDLDDINRHLHGQVIDYTHNHGADRRIWSSALHEKRDLYVYLPPGFDPAQQYPIFLYLHAFTQDESHFLKYIVPLFDRAVAHGELPPAIVICPDGSIPGKPAFFNSASFYANTRAGCFEDFVMQDVWPFVTSHYPVRPEREAHVIVGGSMGGSAAFRLAFTYPETFRIIIGIFPAVNLRWVDCHGRYMGDFDPDCWGVRTRVHPNEVVGRFYGGTVKVRFKYLSRPLFGHGPQSLEGIARINPIEVMDAVDVQPGQFDMYIAYGDRDEFNIDAQVESFVYRARQRGLDITVRCLPGGRHDVDTGTKLFPGAVAWVAPLLAPYSPACGSAP
jgi:S-formylglutathione hydrolase FrmB